jgi:hypothetical protein
MGLRKAGKLRLSKSGKAVEVVVEGVAWNDYFYAPLSQVKEVLEGKRFECDLARLVADSRENV